MDRPRRFVPHDEQGGLGSLVVLALAGAGIVAAILILGSLLRGFSPFSSIAEQLSLIPGRSPSIVAVRDDNSSERTVATSRTAGPLRFATPTVASSSAAAGTTPVATTGAQSASGGDPFAGSAASVSNASPVSGGNITLTLTLVRDGKPQENVPVYAVAHYRTVPNLRWPSATGTVRTDRQGKALLNVNIGNATPGYEIKVDLVAEIEGVERTWTTAFTPQ
jgi:hypothetical protein